MCRGRNPFRHSGARDKQARQEAELPGKVMVAPRGGREGDRGAGSHRKRSKRQRQDGGEESRRGWEKPSLSTEKTLLGRKAKPVRYSVFLSTLSQREVIGYFKNM